MPVLTSNCCSTASTSTAEKRAFALSHQPSAPLVLLLSLSLLLPTVTTAAVLTIDAESAPETNTSLQYHLCGPGAGELVSDTTLQLSGGVHTLQEGSFCILQNLNNLSLQGRETQPRTTIYCESETEARRGFAFFNVSNLHLSNLVIINCGREVPSGLPGNVNDTFTYLGSLQKAVMVITHSSDVTLDNVSIEGCFGFGVLVINPLVGLLASGVTVIGTNNQSLNECEQSSLRSDMLCSGSGIVIIFSDTNITEDQVNAEDNYTVNVSIKNCSIVNNTNLIPIRFLLDLLSILGEGLTSQRILLTGGVSLGIYIGQRNYFVDISITDTEIISNYGSIGNTFVMHYNTLRTSSTKLDRNLFSDNEVDITGYFDLDRGGGLMVIVAIFYDMLSSFSQSHNDIYDIVEIDHCSFARNSAFYGGALMLYMVPQNFSHVRVVIRDTSFTENVARFGAVLYALQFQSVINNNRNVFFYMEDVTASCNTFPNSNILDNSPENAGVFQISHTGNMTLVGTPEKGCLFVNNSVSVVASVQADIVLRGKITFRDNTGFRGGALSLIDTSILFIHDGSDLTFTRNSAFQDGGAIYTNTLGTSFVDICSIQFVSEKRLRLTREDLQLLDLSIVFTNNSVTRAGNSIFGNPLYFCVFVPMSSITHTNIFTLEEILIYEEVFRFPEKVQNRLSEIVSIQERICICKNTTFNPSYCAVSDSLDDPIIPGATLILYLTPIDVASTPVASLLYSSARPLNQSLSNMVDIGKNQDIRPLPGHIECSPVEFQIFALENVPLSLDLFIAIGGQKVTIELNTTSCPPGFTLGFLEGSSTRPLCVCSDFIEGRLGSVCNLTDYTVARPTNYWIGTSSNSDGSTIVQFVSTCPIHYCREDVVNVDLRVPDQLCTQGRTGRLCGACKAGLSSVFGGSAECRKCSNAWLATLLLFALVGALLTTSFFILDVTITHGLVNSLFFFSNIVLINSNIFFQGNVNSFLFIYTSWLNLDLGFPLCFYNGMTESAKLGFQYIFPAYIFVMIGLIVAVSQRSLTVQRILSQLDGLHVFVTMSYIAFLKLVRTVIDTSTLVTLVSEDKEDGDRIVWFFDGTQEPSGASEIVLILVGAFTIVVFIIPYVVLFVFSTLIQRRINSTRFNAYLDASLSPYKDNLRFWFGARLILTLVIYIMVANRGTNNPTLTVTLELSFLVGFTVIQAYIRPFKSLLVSIVDLSSFINLIALTLGVSYTAQRRERFQDQEILVNFSLSVAFITHMFIILWHLLRALRRNKKFKDKTDRLLGGMTALLSALKLRDRKEIMDVIAGQRGA